MRGARKRGVVPVYISTSWFLFSLAISIQSAFGLIGLNVEAHDLALGCLLAWLPVLILCSIVDRNPVYTDDIRNKLNYLVDRVRLSLKNDTVRSMYLETIHNRDYQASMREWVEKISRQCDYMNDFFIDFAGQGRQRWHYGCSHPITHDIERAFIAREGRDWLRHEEEARTLLVLGDVRGGLDLFDNRELWQISGAIFVVGGTILGASVLSYFTPTVGLGCRTFGYLLFWIIACVLLCAEIGCWWVFDARKERLDELVERTINRRPAINSRWEGFYTGLAHATTIVSQWSHAVAESIHRFVTNLIPDTLRDAYKKWYKRHIRPVNVKWQDLNARTKLEYVIFKPAEAFNTIWLIYIVLAQTFGAYQTCDCMTSHYGGKDYLDFTQYDTTNSKWVKYSWTGGASTSILIMSGAMLYVVIQWLLQSHLATVNSTKAARGLRRTRRFRWLITLYRLAVNKILGWLENAFVRLSITKASTAPSLLWTVHETCEKQHHTHRNGRPNSQEGQELTTMLRLGVQDPDGRQLLPSQETQASRDRSPGTPSSHSSYGPPSPATPTLSPRAQDRSPRMVQRSTYDRRPSNENLGFPTTYQSSRYGRNE